MVSCYHWVSISIFKNCVCACGVSCWYRGRSTPEKGLLPNLDLAVLARMARQGSPPGIWAGFLWPTRWRTLLQGVLLSTGRPWHTVKHPFYKLQWLKQSDPQRRAQHTAGTAPPSGKPISLTQLSQQGCFTDSDKLSGQPTLLPCWASRILPDGPLSSRQARYEGW